MESVNMRPFELTFHSNHPHSSLHLSEVASKISITHGKFSSLSLNHKNVDTLITIRTNTFLQMPPPKNFQVSLFRIAPKVIILVQFRGDHAKYTFLGVSSGE